MVFRRLLRPLRRLSATFFYNFGLHCAKNQIRVILISDLVITSLFYPALAIYFSSQPLSHFSTRLQDSLLALPYTDNLGSYRADLQDIWEVLDVRLQEDTATQARCGSERTVRLERLLIPSVQPDDVHGALNKETFSAVLELQDRLQSLLTSPAYRDVLDCINDPQRSAQVTCLVFGPLEYWQNDKSELDQSRNVIETINSARDIIKAGVPLNKELTLARRGAVDERDWIYEADFLVLTYFFPETDCHANTRHVAWSQAVQEAVAGLGSAAQIPKQPKLLALQLSTEQLTYRASVLSVILYICYIVIFVYFSGALRRINTVHSRFGLAFTGMVEIVASTITSVSVCALWGFRVTMIPWAILPVMIVFIGAEDMFILVQEVVSTPITYPVKERIAQGLSRAGTSNTFKVCAYNAIFGSMAYFTTGAIKQFCIFTVVVLVAHWFLIHTFFVAVLAIDIQRLELADMIHQGPRIHSTVNSPAKEKVIEEVSSATSKGRWRFFRLDRAAKNGSLFVILSITALLYYASLPTTPIPTKVTTPKPTDAARASFFQSMGVAQETSKPLDDFPLLSSSTSLPSGKSSMEFWKIFNPENNSLLHLRVESPTFVQLRPTHVSPQLPIGKRKALSRSLRPLTWTMKIVVLPMSATALALYGLLLYLLKDTELLEAQRNRAESDGTSPDYDTESLAGKSLEGSASFFALSRPFVADVELITSSKDGRVIAAISTEDELAVWHVEDEGQREVGRKTLQLSTALAAIGRGDLRDVAFTSIALDETGERCAVGTSIGVVLTWSVEEGMWSMKHARCGTDTSIAHLEFLPPAAVSMSASTQTIKPKDSKAKPDPFHILARSSKGTAFLWNPSNQVQPPTLPLPITLTPTEPAVLTDGSGGIKVACGLPDGSLRILSSTLDSATDDLEHWGSQTISNVGDDTDFVTQISISVLFVGPRRVEMVAVATTSGRVMVYECGDGQLVCALTGNFEEVTRLRLISVPWQRCDKCGEMEPDSFGVAFSAASVIDVHRVVAVLVPSRCSCPMTQLLRGSGSRTGLREKYMAQRSRSSSIASSPALRRMALPSTKTASLADYPLPQHGYHSRKTSERESRPRLSTETASDGTEFDAESSLGEASSTLAVPGIGDSPLRVRTGSALGGSLKVVKVEEIPYDRGTWDVAGPLVIGIRRRPRRIRGSTVPAGEGEAATRRPSPFSRWDAWVYDLPKGELSSSPLLALKRDEAQDIPTNGHTHPLPNGNSLIQRSASLRRLVELSGPQSSALKSSKLSSSPSPSTMARDSPVLPFTRVSALYATPGRCCLGLGNTAAILDLHVTRKSSDKDGSKKLSPFGSMVDKKFL